MGAAETERAIATVERAGIEERGAFSEWLSSIAEGARKAMADAPEPTACETAEDYRYLKATLAGYRKVRREADEGRKRITSELDAAKKGVMSYVADSVAPLDEAIARMSALQKSAEEAKRAAKRGRLEAYWERAYPALALCTGEAERPLVPFDRVYDPDWVKRVGELGSDAKAEEAMDGVAQRLAGGEEAIASMPEDERALALSRMFETLDPVGAISWAREEAARRRDIERLREARAASIAGTAARDAPSAPETPQVAPEPVAAVSAQPEPQRAAEAPSERYRVVIECASAEECARVRAVMVGNGIHGRIERM